MKIVMPTVMKKSLIHLGLDYEKVLFFRRFVKFREELIDNYGITSFEMLKQFFLLLHSPQYPFDLNAMLMMRCFLSPWNDRYFYNFYERKGEKNQDELDSEEIVTRSDKKRKIEF